MNFGGVHEPHLFRRQRFTTLPEQRLLAPRPARRSPSRVSAAFLVALS